MRPHAQSALMALAHLAYTRGRRAEALEYVRQLADATLGWTAREPWVRYAEDTDPWSWYFYGTAWRFPTYLARLRDMVREKQGTGRRPVPQAHRGRR